MSNENKPEVRIAISGKSGCGNTTISRLVADALELRFINFTFRNLAKEKGLELLEIIEMAVTDDTWDREVDSRQVNMAREPGGCVLGSRLAIWMLPEADLKVYLTARPETRVARIQKREGGSMEEIARITDFRDKEDNKRYKRIYNIDNDDFAFADLIIDTDSLNPMNIAEIIVKKLQEKLPDIDVSWATYSDT